MIIGERLRVLREVKKLCKATLKRRPDCFVATLSRFKNGSTVPSIETLEKMARALEIPIYKLFCDGEEPPNYRIFGSGRPPTIFVGATRARTHECLVSSVACFGRIASQSALQLQQQRSQDLYERHACLSGHPALPFFKHCTAIHQTRGHTSNRCISRLPRTRGRHAGVGELSP